jgi:hypothetical protein
LFSPENTPIISVVSIGEAKSLAIQRKWGKRKVKKLENLLRKLLVASINAETIIESMRKLMPTVKENCLIKQVHFRQETWVKMTFG